MTAFIGIYAIQFPFVKNCWSKIANFEIEIRAIFHGLARNLKLWTKSRIIIRSGIGHFRIYKSCAI